MKPVIKAKYPPHTFMSARSYLLLEEASNNHDAKTQAGHALYAGRGGSSSSNTGSGDAGSGSSSGGGFNRSKKSTKKRSKGSTNPGSSGPPPTGAGFGAATPT